MNNIIFQELIKKQRNNLVPNKKLSISDLKRIASNLNTSIFSEECSLWLGYVTEIKSKNTNKTSSFINFFFNGKKQILNRLLFYNFIDNLSDAEYLKYSCPNKGHCCNINHISKVSSENSVKIENVENNDIKQSKNKKDITVEF